MGGEIIVEIIEEKNPKQIKGIDIQIGKNHYAKHGEQKEYMF